MTRLQLSPIGSRHVLYVRTPRGNLIQAMGYADAERMMEYMPAGSEVVTGRRVRRNGRTLHVLHPAGRRA